MNLGRILILILILILIDLRAFLPGRVIFLPHFKYIYSEKPGVSTEKSLIQTHDEDK